jgi:hypothetical protein
MYWIRSYAYIRYLTLSTIKNPDIAFRIRNIIKGARIKGIFLSYSLRKIYIIKRINENNGNINWSIPRQHHRGIKRIENMIILRQTGNALKLFIFSFIYAISLDFCWSF